MIILLGVLCTLILLWVLSRTEGFTSECCGTDFRPKTINIDNKEINLSHFQYVVNKHNDMAKKGILPFIPLWEELGISKDNLDTLLGA